jgi:hypothetical protein
MFSSKHTNIFNIIFHHYKSQLKNPNLHYDPILLDLEVEVEASSQEHQLFLVLAQTLQHLVPAKSEMKIRNFYMENTMNGL